MCRMRILCVLMALFAARFTQISRAQAQDHLERKTVSKIAPFYPEVAKRNRIKGVVKLEIVVRKNGSVQSVKVLGGSPFLIEAATVAVGKWRFESGPLETTEVVQLVFDN
jgi:TonB family protein